MLRRGSMGSETGVRCRYESLVTRDWELTGMRHLLREITSHSLYEVVAQKK